MYVDHSLVESLSWTIDQSSELLTDNSSARADSYLEKHYVELEPCPAITIWCKSRFDTRARCGSKKQLREKIDEEYIG